MAVLAIGTVGSLIGYVRSETRATEAHKFALSNATELEKRASQGFGLAITGEIASQSRAAEVHEKFLAGSRETLDLVNATLTLAKEASERAAKAIETKARVTLEELDQECQSLLASVPAQDDRALVANPASRSDLRSLAHKIAGFEINRFVLPENIQLTAPCLFIRGMDFHLNQQFDDAFRSWRSVALTPETANGLKSLAWYWIGYEQNNLNRFGEAEQSFENALQLATGSRRYELNRILIETRFFNKAKYPAQALIQPLENLLDAISRDDAREDHDAPKMKVVITLGNVVSQVGRELSDEGKREEAHRMFERARDVYGQAAEQDKWALFGLGEMLDHLGETQEAQQLFQRVRGKAIEESVRRDEPRTKVLARTTELICCLRVPSLNSEATSIRSLVLQDLGRVDERMTVYSQVQKRNVTKTEFQADLEKLMSANQMLVK